MMSAIPTPVPHVQATNSLKVTAESCAEHTKTQCTEDRYLDLLMNVLAFTLWPEPPVPIEAFNSQRSPVKGLAARFVSGILRSRQLQLVKYRHFTADQRQEGRFWPTYAHTMIGLKRLANLRFCVETVIREDIAGDMIEAGAWRGGACILMRAVLAAYGVENRKIYVADSFEGLPKSDPAAFPADKDDQHHRYSFLAVSQDEVENNFRKYDLLDEQVVVLKGWFENTLPGAPIERLALLRLDGDMYGSTMVTLKSLYPKLSSGGFCIVDDYALDGCRKAVDDFRAMNDIGTEMKVVDWTGRYWRKE